MSLTHAACDQPLMNSPITKLKFCHFSGKALNNTSEHSEEYLRGNRENGDPSALRSVGMTITRYSLGRADPAPTEPMLQVTLHKKSPVACATGDLLQLYFIGQLLLLYNCLFTINNIYSRLCNLLKLAAAEVIDTFQLFVYTFHLLNALD